MIIAHLYKKPLCSACEELVPRYCQALLQMGVYAAVWDVSDAEGLGKAAWADRADADTQLPALALWESGNPEYIASYQFPLPPIEEIEKLLEGKI